MYWKYKTKTLKYATSSWGCKWWFLKQTCCRNKSGSDFFFTSSPKAKPLTTYTTQPNISIHPFLVSYLWVHMEPFPYLLFRNPIPMLTKWHSPYVHIPMDTWDFLFVFDKKIQVSEERPQQFIVARRRKRSQYVMSRFQQ